MEYTIREATEDDAPAVMEIMNYYINHSQAAFFEQELPLPVFQAMITTGGDYPCYVIATTDDQVIGYGFIRSHHPAPAFKHTAELAYFILPEHTRQGLGQRLLDTMVTEARDQGITILLASISSLNPVSISFHLAQGFKESGRLTGIGRKFGQDFDVVLMQRTI